MNRVKPLRVEVKAYLKTLRECLLDLAPDLANGPVRPIFFNFFQFKRLDIDNHLRIPFAKNFQKLPRGLVDMLLQSPGAISKDFVIDGKKKVYHGSICAGRPGPCRSQPREKNLRKRSRCSRLRNCINSGDTDLSALRNMDHRYPAKMAHPSMTKVFLAI